MDEVYNSPPGSLEEEEEFDSKKAIREKVNLILPDSLMIILAGIMVPIVLIPIFVDLPESLDASFKFIDYSILGIFIIEYLLKLALAKNRIKHFLNPWHLLDLLVVLFPFVSLIPAISAGFGYSPLLRLLRIIRVAAIGGRALDRKIALSSNTLSNKKVEILPMEIRVMDGALDKVYENVSFKDIKSYLENTSESWVDITSVSETDFEQISKSLGIPRIILESELIDESYPRVDYFEHYSMIFARVADIKILYKRSMPLSISRTGLLVICQGQNILTLSKTRNGLFKLILENTRKNHTPGEPVSVSILYSLLRYVLDKDKQITAALEKELMRLESIPVKDRPSNFLETTFYLRKEVNQLVPSLLHLKELISNISAKRVPLEGFSEKHVRIFDILLDEADYLHETASNARDNLLSLIDLYINTTSYEMNKVMRVIAVITSLSIVPAVMGLLGSNITGNPWDIQLWQVFSVLGVLMLFLGWVFYRLGWLKG
jgi:Mg2+ and Co2+ transporter CorA